MKLFLTLEFTLGGGLHGGLDLLISDRLLGAAGQVDHGDVGSRHTHGHTGQLAVEGRNNLSDSLGGTGAAGDDVLGSSTASSPVLGGGSVHDLLGGSVGVDSGHETLNQTPVVVDDLGKGSETVGGARGVGDDLVFRLVSIEIDTTDEHGGISRGGRDDDLLGTTLQVSSSLFGGSED